MTNWQNDPSNPALAVAPRDVNELVEDGRVVVDTVLPLESQSVAEAAERTDNVDELTKLGQTRKENYAGDFVLNNQTTAKTHSHVSQLWFDKCMTYEQGMEVLADQQSNILDIRKPLLDWEAVVTADDRFALRYKPTGREYFPTENAMQNLMATVPNKDKGSVWQANNLNNPEATKTKANGDDEVCFKRDRRDAQLLRDMVNLIVFQADRVDQKKVRLFRTWDNDNTLRAVLSKDYTIVNNQWFLQTVAKLIPGGMLSHWKGDADAIFGNILIPDSIREEEDSPYGGMLSIGNSEIGTRRITSVPSVFRAICMNGCIWDQELGKGINQVHRKKDGKIDLDGLAASIQVNLEKQIPLIDSGIRLLLAKKHLGFDTVEPARVMAAAIKHVSIPKKLAKGVMQAYRVESELVGDNAFTVIQAITRYGQTLNAMRWVEFDMKAGTIAKMDESKWRKIVAVAKTLDDKDLEKIGVV